MHVQPLSAHYHHNMMEQQQQHPPMAFQPLGMQQQMQPPTGAVHGFGHRPSNLGEQQQHEEEEGDAVNRNQNHATPHRRGDPHPRRVSFSPMIAGGGRCWSNQTAVYSL